MEPPRFLDLAWEDDERGADWCRRARARFPNGWTATFLRGPRCRNSSIHMDPARPGLFVGEYEIQPWMPDGGFPREGPLSGWPFHGDAARMQAVMDLIATQ